MTNALHDGQEDGRGHDSLFEFRPLGPIPIWPQALLVVLGFVATVLITYEEYRRHGTTFGYPGPAFSMLFVPIYEELFFRGFLLERLRRHWNVPWSVVFSSAVFGIWHLRNIYWKDFESLAGQVVFTGMIFGPIVAWITLRARSVWPAVIVHYANNLLGHYVW